MPEEKKENDSKNEEAAPEKAEQKPTAEEELKDRLLRLAAEYDNYKKRTMKEVEGAKLMGRAELMLKMLPILDEFEIALDALDIKVEKEKGLALVFSNFVDTLKKEGLTELVAKGVVDPYKHEIMLAKEGNEKEGTIIDVVRKGYMLNGIMLRPASVIVSKGVAETEKKE
jgi:molecular chaperone GrpE